jgi:predicted RNase H-like nuclease (RuvC/YqgF family)
MEMQANSDKLVQVDRLLELIQQTSQLLTLYRNAANPNPVAIAQYTDIRDELLDELSQLFREFDVEIEGPVDLAA